MSLSSRDLIISKKGPRVGGGLGGPRIEGYGWGYIGRGFKGGFYKSGISLGFWDHLVPIFWDHLVPIFSRIIQWPSLLDSQF